MASTATADTDDVTNIEIERIKVHHTQHASIILQQTKTSSRATITTGSSSKVSITDNFIKPIKFTNKAQRNQNQQLPLTVT